MKRICLCVLIVMSATILMSLCYTVSQDGTGNFLSIQDAINAASDLEDTQILVYPSNNPYGSIEVMGWQHNLIIESRYSITGNESDIQNTIITNPSVLGTGVYIFGSANNMGTNSITIKGFTISGNNGWKDPNNSDQDHRYGGGVCCRFGSSNNQFNQEVNIEHCYITNNNAYFGGGVFSIYTDLHIRSCEISSNYLYGDSLLFDSSAQDNIGPKGGGIMMEGGNSEILDSKIFSNRTYRYIDDFCRGNAAGIFIAYDCPIENAAQTNIIDIKRNIIYENDTSVNPQFYGAYNIDSNPYGCRWYYTASAIWVRLGFIDPDGLPHHQTQKVNICNNTIVNNHCAATNRIDNETGVLLTRHDVPGYSLENNIVLFNTEGQNYTTSNSQLQGGLDPNNNSPFYMIIPVTMRNSDVSDYNNSTYYLQNSTFENFFADPLFIDYSNYDYHLTWTVDEKSPCIDSGYKEQANLLYNRPDIGALEFDGFDHNTFTYTFPPRATNQGIKWISFPVLFNVENEQFINEITMGDFIPDDIQNFFVLQQIEWNDILLNTNNTNTFEYFDNIWQNSNHIVTSKQGYKVQMDELNTAERTSEVSGFLQDVNTQVQLFGLHNGQYKENWLGYYYPGKKHVFDAFNEFIDELWYIQTQNWTLIRQYSQLGGPWVGVLTPASKPLILLPGDMVVVKCFRDFTYTWSDFGPEREPLPPLKPEHFEYLEKFEYIPILTDFRNSNIELPKEIAVYINGVCKGAAVVTDSLAQILAYICDDIPDNPELEFMLYYDNKSMGIIPEYNVWNPQTNLFQNEKLIVNKKQNYFLVNITKANVSETQLPSLNLTNYPNPFNPITNIRYYIPDEDRVKIGIYNSKGQLVKVLVDKRKAAGMQEAIWDGTGDNGKSCSSGIYYCKLNFREKNISKKLVLMK